MALQSPESVFFSQRPMDEETLPLPPRNEKSSPSKTAAVTVSRVVNLVFPKPSSTVPGLEAKPAEIREFLARLLVNKCGLQEDKASCIVSGWKIGSGLELRQYGAAMYLDLFGCEYGWILYREVKMSVRKEKRLITRYPLHTVTITAVSAMVTTITLLATKDFDEGLTIFLVCSASFSTITCFVCLFLQCWGTSESKMIERELRAATRELHTEREADRMVAKYLGLDEDECNCARDPAQHCN